MELSRLWAVSARDIHGCGVFCVLCDEKTMPHFIGLLAFAGNSLQRSI
jgi:hypothetical protein